MPALTHQEEAEALRLFTVQSEDGQVASVIPVRWCISRETARMLQDQEIKDPQLLLVISHDGTELDRRIVPLTAEMHYIQFRRPGENVVHATIVWQGLSDADPPKKVLTYSYDSGAYKAKVLRWKEDTVDALLERVNTVEARLSSLESSTSYDEYHEYVRLKAERDQLEARLDDARKEPHQVSIRDDFDGVQQLGYEAQLGVLVPDDMFAKEPPKWMKWLSSRYTFWPRAAQDQCDLRRRAIFTGATLPFWALGHLAWYAIVGLAAVFGVTLNLVTMAVLLFFGMRGMKLEFLLHPFENNPKSIWRSAHQSFWLNRAVPKTVVHNRGTDHEREDKWFEYEERPGLFCVLNPPVIVFFLAVGEGITLLSGSTIWLIVGGLAAVALILVVLIGSALAKGPLSGRSAQRAAEKERRVKELETAREEAQRRAREDLGRELELLACTERSREVSLRALPKERRTVVLRYYDLKAKVCKPFAAR